MRPFRGDPGGPDGEPPSTHDWQGCKCAHHDRDMGDASYWHPRLADFEECECWLT